MDGPYLNTDRELWREEEKDELSAASIHVTQSGGIGINVGGSVIVMSLRDWHAAGNLIKNLAEWQAAKQGAKDIPLYP